MFSPYYAFARRFGDGDPHNHCALNVALYGPSKHWALTERGRGDLVRDENRLRIGPSSLAWDGTTLTIAVDETTVPFPSRIKGTIRIRPRALTGLVFDLDAKGRHCWRPIAPYAEIEVAMESPRLAWTGSGYLDWNCGDEPLEDAFIEWDWTRAHAAKGTHVLYDVDRRDGSSLSLALEFDAQGRVSNFDPPPMGKLPRTLWGIRRNARSDDGQPRLVKTLEDTPFYARSLVGTTLRGSPVVAVHESLSLDRVANPIVRAMLPFRMPRWPG